MKNNKLLPALIAIVAVLLIVCVTLGVMIARKNKQTDATETQELQTSAADDTAGTDAADADKTSSAAPEATGAAAPDAQNAPADEKEALRAILTSHTWEHDIQSHDEITFLPDGTLQHIEGIGEPVRYEVESDNVVVLYTSDQYPIKLKYMKKTDTADWEKDLTFYNGIYQQLSDDEYFLYEIDYVPDELGMGNAYWLRSKE